MNITGAANTGFGDRTVAAAKKHVQQAWSVSWTALISLVRQGGTDLSASLAFFTLLSLFPLVSLAIVIMSTFVDEESLRGGISDMVTFFLPTSESLLQSAIDQLFQARLTAGLIAVAGMLIGSTGLFMAANRAVNRVYGRKPRSSLHASVAGLLVTAAISFLFLVSIAMGIAFRLAVTATETTASTVGISGAVLITIQISTFLMPFVLTGVAFAIVYKVVPQGRVEWRDVIIGACVAILLHELAKHAFLWIGEVFSERNALYGPLSSAVILLTGAWVAGMIFLYGASIAKQVAVSRPKPTRTVVDLMRHRSE